MHVRTFLRIKVFLKSVDTIRFQLKPNNNTFCTKRYTHVLWTSLSRYSLHTHNLYNGAKTVSNKYRTLCPINVFLGKFYFSRKLKGEQTSEHSYAVSAFHNLTAPSLTYLSPLLYRVPIFLCSLPPFLSFFIFLKLQSSFFFAFI